MPLDPDGVNGAIGNDQRRCAAAHILRAGILIIFMGSGGERVRERGTSRGDAPWGSPLPAAAASALGGFTFGEAFFQMEGLQAGVGVAHLEHPVVGFGEAELGDVAEVVEFEAFDIAGEGFNFFEDAKLVGRGGGAGLGAEEVLGEEQGCPGAFGDAEGGVDGEAKLGFASGFVKEIGPGEAEGVGAFRPGGVWGGAFLVILAVKLLAVQELPGKLLVPRAQGDEGAREIKVEAGAVDVLAEDLFKLGHNALRPVVFG